MPGEQFVGLARRSDSHQCGRHRRAWRGAGRCSGYEGDRTYDLEADSPQDAERWLNGLRAAITQKQQQVEAAAAAETAEAAAAAEGASAEAVPADSGAAPGLPLPPPDTPPPPGPVDPAVAASGLVVGCTVRQMQREPYLPHSPSRAAELRERGWPVCSSGAPRSVSLPAQVVVAKEAPRPELRALWAAPAQVAELKVLQGEVRAKLEWPGRPEDEARWFKVRQ